MSCSDVAEAFQTIQREINLLKYQNKRLSEENSRLKNENYKDEELSKMKTQLEKMQQDYYRGFPISEEEQKSIRKWMDKHDEEVHHTRTLGDKLKLGGCCGGRYTYKFIPTSIGTLGTVKCNCGAEFIFHDIE